MKRASAKSCCCRDVDLDCQLTAENRGAVGKDRGSSLADIHQVVAEIVDSRVQVTYGAEQRSDPRRTWLGNGDQCSSVAHAAYQSERDQRCWQWCSRQCSFRNIGSKASQGMGSLRAGRACRRTQLPENRGRNEKRPSFEGNSNPSRDNTVNKSDHICANLEEWVDRWVGGEVAVIPDIDIVEAVVHNAELRTPHGTSNEYEMATCGANSEDTSWQ